MKRKLLLVLAFIALPGFAYALGLGKLQLNSALNQPFDARIELLSASADEIDSLNVGLADTEAFRRARIDRPFVLTSLNFKVVENESGADYIHITSREAIREPFLNFLLETNWSSGRLYREYTVLLDPPLYDPAARKSSPSASYSSGSSTSESYITDDSDSDTTPTTLVSGGFSGDEYGPTDSSDTLWSIASRVRPDSGVSIQQVMLALLRSNPDAFINGNINGLKRGQILNVPSRAEIDSMSGAEAVSEVSSQNSSWQGGSGLVSSSPAARADSMDMASDSSSDMDDATSSTMIEDEESELRLVAASSEGAAGTGQGGGGSSVDLTLANERVQAVTQENIDLKDRVQEAETIINDLKRLIALKDDELAALQQQMAGGGVVDATGITADSMDVVEEEFAAEEEIADEEEVAAFATEEDSLLDEDAAAGSDMEDEVVATGEELPGDEEADTGMEEAMDADTEEAMAESEVMDEADTAAVETVADVPPPAGLVDQALDFIMGNLIVILGALGGLVIATFALLFISRRRQNAVTEAGPVSTPEFPDFDEADDGMSEHTAESVSDMATPESEDETVLPTDEQEEVEQADDKTAFVAPADPVPQAAAPAVEEPEEDPLAEVNVLIAYEQFDQAEEFVRDAISNDPDRADFHSKLLEVFYSANDKKKYEEAARVLSEKVDSQGPHWEMALAMWQEMSPNRALFEEGGDESADEAPAAAEGSGGIVDITAEDDAASADAGVDFDLGMDFGDQAAPSEASTSEDEDVLDLTSDHEDISVLDVTAAISVNESTADEDLLDVTSAVGLGTEEAVQPDTADDDEPMLDITAGPDTSSAEAEDDVLDISHAGNEDLLDVTANANLEPEGMEEDLLDVTSSVGAEADGEELQELSTEESADDDNSLDFDIGAMETAAEVSDEETGTNDENVIDFDTGAGGDTPSLELDAGPEEAGDDDGGVEFDLSMDDEGDLGLADEPAEISIDELEDNSDDGLEIDLSIDDDNDAAADLEIDSGGSDDLEIDLTLDDGVDDAELADSQEVELDMDFDLEIQDDSKDVPEIDMEGTVEMPKLDLDDTGDLGIEIDDDDDDDDHTVFVPRAGAADEQSAEDEIATKLDLAKAYVELGDKDSAMGILNEVMADGNDEQKQTAQDLLNQLG